MEVTITKKVVLKLIRELLESNGEKNAPAVVVEPPVQELPVSQNPEIEGGPFEMPPIEDEEYLPDTPVELAQAAYAVGKSIPSQDVHKFWKALDRLVADSLTWQEDKDMDNSIVEEKLRRQIRQILRETGMSDSAKADDAAAVADADTTPPPRKLTRAQKVDLIKKAARREKLNQAHLRQQGRDEKKRLAHMADQEGEYAAGADDFLEPGESQADFDKISYEDVVGDRPGDETGADSGGPIDYFGESPPTRWDDPDPRFKTKQQKRDDIRREKEDREELRAAERERVAAMEPGQRGRPGSWEEIADIFSFKSPSGAKQMVDDPGRLMDKVRFLFNLDSSDPNALDDLRRSHVNIYADDLLKGGEIDDEDAAFLKAHPEYTDELDTYRVYLKRVINSAMRKDPDSQKHIAGRRETAASARAANKARRAKAKADKQSKGLGQFR